MEEMTPGQKKIMASRLKTQLELMEGNKAKLTKNKRLEVTPTQMRDAYAEMLIAQGPKFTKTVAERTEIKETRIFSAKEIIELIAVRQGLDAKDLRVGHYSVDKNENLITADIILRHEVALEKFGQDAHYQFEIKSSLISGEPVIKKTLIELHVQDSEADKAGERSLAKDDANQYMKDIGFHRQVEDDEEDLAEDYEGEFDSEEILEFDGTKWLYLN